MSKIICDVCGTSYPESATQCPICGCVRPADVNTVQINVDETAARPSGTYTYVKGGRFSKANVKKRNSGKPIASTEAVVKAEKPAKDNDNKDNKALLIGIAAVVIVILAVAIFIGVSFLVPSDAPNGAETSAATTEASIETTTDAIPCESIEISKPIITFDHPGAAIYVNVKLTPADTTDILCFSSADDSVATVDEEGRITAVGPGFTAITVSCGSAEVVCQVACEFETETTAATDESTEATEATTEPTTEPVTSNVQIKLNREDFTLSGKGSTWKLYDGEIPADQITWSSDDEKVVTIKNGIVTAIGGGYTTVYAEYQGQKVSCVVRCNAPVASENDTAAVQGAYKLNTEDRSNDVTLTRIGEQFVLSLLDENNNTVEVVWQIDNPSVCSAEGNTITALGRGIANVSVTVDGVTYTCIVRVSA